MTTAELTTTRETEADRVVRWRRERLLAAGYGEDDALLVAHLPHVDLHLAVELLERGCRPRTALRILL